MSDSTVARRLAAGAGIGALTLAALSAWRVTQAPVPGARPPIAATPAREHFERGLDSLRADLDSLARHISDRDRAPSQHWFRLARRDYKRVEPLLADVAPTLAQQLNGPLPAESEDRPAGPLGAPAQFQIVEGAIFPGGASPGRDSVRATIGSMRASLEQFRPLTRYIDASPRVVLDAARLELARVTALGLAGFDSDLSGDAVVEAAASLDGMRALAFASRNGDPSWVRLDSALAAASAYLRTHPDFRSLDRLEFITDHVDPVGRSLAAARASLPDTLVPLRRFWRQRAATLFEEGAFDPSAYAPDFAPTSSPALVALGARLFAEPRLSGPGTRSCAFCHDPARSFTDGRPQAQALPGTHLNFPRRVPTLLNAAYQPTLFDDSRAASLESQAELVLASPAEMGGSAALGAERLAHDSSYREAFARAFVAPAEGAVTARAVRIALAAYVRSLSSLGSRFDLALRGERGVVTEEERRGFTLFMGKARCGTCHFLPLFNGTMPPDFVLSEPEIIGVPARAGEAHPRLDPDPGRAGVDHEPTHRAAFQVPTVRNASLIAPYMHNGAFATLEQVVDFYDRGGGAGAGERVPGQTLPERPLHLTRAEKDDLIAFLGSLTDSTVLRRSDALATIARR